MEQRANSNDSFPETFDANLESPEDYVDRVASLSNRLSPVDTRCTSTGSNHDQVNRGWDRAESSSTGNNLQEQFLDDDLGMEFAWYSSSGASSSYVRTRVADTTQNTRDYSSSSWGSSCKRKAVEGSSGHFCPGGSSGSDHPMENTVQDQVHGRCPASRDLSISSRNEPVRNFPSRRSPGEYEPAPFDASTGVSVGNSSQYASQPQLHGVSNSSSLELMSPTMLPLDLSNSRNEPLGNTNEIGPTHPLPWNESRRGSSSSSLLLPQERGYRAHEGGYYRRSVRNFPEYPTIVPPSDIDWSFTPGISASSRNYSGSSASLSRGNQSSQDQRRFSEDSPWIHFPSIEPDQRSPFAPLHVASTSADERVDPNHSQHPLDRRTSSFLTDARGDSNTNGLSVLAAVEGRHRLLRQVLSAMRSGSRFQDEDYALIDPLFNGLAELHDQHRDMRLDVDNMSYEELLALGEQIGDVSTGASEETIKHSMKSHEYEASQATEEPCCICLEDYIGGDEVGILDCGHEFHTSCIKQWLILKNICPVCKNPAFEN